MIVTFSCPAHADITMFGNVASQMLKMMGHSGTVPGAILAEDVGDTLRRLEAAVAASEESAPPADNSDPDDDDREPAVSLKHRALPLIELLRAADAAQCNVMWEAA